MLVYACASGIDSPSTGLLRGESATLSECTVDAWPRASAEWDSSFSQSIRRRFRHRYGDRACRRADTSTSRGVHGRAQPRVFKVVGMWPLSSARLTDRLVLRRLGSSRGPFSHFFRVSQGGYCSQPLEMQLRFACHLGNRRSGRNHALRRNHPSSTLAGTFFLRSGGCGPTCVPASCDVFIHPLRVVGQPRSSCVSIVNVEDTGLLKKP